MFEWLGIGSSGSMVERKEEKFGSEVPGFSGFEGGDLV